MKTQPQNQGPRPLVHLRVGELGSRKADLAVCRVEHVIEPLEEDHAVDKVESFSARRAEVGCDEVHEVVRAPNRGVEL